MNMPKTKLIPNGDNIVHTFTDTEYKNRQARLRQHMAANNIDAVIFSSCLLYTSPSPRDATLSRMPSSA